MLRHYNFTTILGRYIHAPHTPLEWYASAEALRLFWISNDPTRPSFCTNIVQQGRGTRHRSKYDWVSNKMGPHPGMYYASVLMFDATCAIMHCKTPIYLPTVPPSTFWERLDSHGNSSLWVNLLYDGDREWIWVGLCGGSLCIAHDGSYMVEELPDLCSAGVIIFCSCSRQWLMSSVPELSDTASNYCGELLEAVIVLLILCVASEGLLQPSLTQPSSAIIRACSHTGTAISRNSRRSRNRLTSFAW